jgi:hypothetical protein
LCSIIIFTFEISRPTNAEVAELVDALGSGSSGRTPVRVRVSPSAPEYNGPATVLPVQVLFFSGLVLSPPIFPDGPNSDYYSLSFELFSCRPARTTAGPPQATHAALFPLVFSRFSKNRFHHGFFFGISQYTPSSLISSVIEKNSFPVFIL